MASSFTVTVRAMNESVCALLRCDVLSASQYKKIIPNRTNGNNSVLVLPLTLLFKPKN